MKTHLNTLYVTTQGSYLAKQGETVQVRVERKAPGAVAAAQPGRHRLLRPRRLLPALLGACADRGVAVSFLTENGRFLASVRGASHGNVLVRRRQYRLADDPAVALDVARRIVLAKVANSRSVLLRAIRDAEGDPDRVADLRAAVTASPPRSTNSDGADTLDSDRAASKGRPPPTISAPSTPCSATPPQATPSASRGEAAGPLWTRSTP